MITTFSSAASFYDVSVVLIFNGVARPTPYLLGVDVASYTDVSSVFSPLNTYAYSITPYNTIGTAGTSIISSTVSPAATISVGTAIYNAVSGITFSLISASPYTSFVPTFSSYYQAAISRIATNRTNTTTTSLTTSYSYSLATYTDSGPFTADTSYSYSIVPINVLGQSNASGIVYTSPILSPVASVSIGSISSTTNKITFTFTSINTFYDASIALITNGVIGQYYLYKPTITTYIDPSNSFIGGILYSYSIIPRNAMGQAGTTYTSIATSPPIPATYAVKALSVIDTSGLNIYYGFDFVTSTTAPSYNNKYMSLIDNSGMNMYYGFDI